MTPRTPYQAAGGSYPTRGECSDFLRVGIDVHKSTPTLLYRVPCFESDARRPTQTAITMPILGYVMYSYGGSVFATALSKIFNQHNNEVERQPSFGISLRDSFTFSLG